MTNPMTKEHLDSGGDNPKLARGELATNVDNFNGVRSLLQGGAVGELLTGQGAGNDPAFSGGIQALLRSGSAGTVLTGQGVGVDPTFSGGSTGFLHLTHGLATPVTDATGDGQSGICSWTSGYDPGGNILGNTIFIPETGLYSINVLLYFQDLSTAPQITSTSIFLVINSVYNDPIRSIVPGLTTDTSIVYKELMLSMDVSMQLDAGDQIAIWYWIKGSTRTVDLTRGYITTFKFGV